MFKINLADYADSAWATCFQETAETILGIKADDLGELKNSVSSFNFKHFDSKLKTCFGFFLE
jgi:hypothetical protein